jgi:serine protease inhibitor
MRPLSKIISLLLFLSLVFLACERITSPLTSKTKYVRALTPNETELVSADNRFGLKLFQQIVKSDSQENPVISPISVSMALGMTLNGANGSTREAMESTLELQGLSQQQINEAYQSLIKLLLSLDPKVDFRIANSIWYRDGLSFEQEFIDLNKLYFNAVVHGLDFSNLASRDIINQWVSNNTNGRIKEIVEKINPNDIMFLINAIYFKGIWTYQFQEDLTHDDLFNLPNGTQIACHLMCQEGKFAYLDTDKFQAIDLPYGDGDFRMTIFLPKSGITVESLILSMDNNVLNQWFQSFSVQKGIIEIPKFELKYKIQLKKVLTLLGMGIAFDPHGADFTKLYSGPQNAFISRVLHKTYIKVDEKGTEAAAVTSVVIDLTSAGNGNEFYFKANRPFLYIIRENHSNTILFIGKMSAPSLN